ncbi:MAG: hypothetical protein GY699_26890 [Desulfobacteraceae bacterium]|nr:hypothetical protein [Desulfobacteraceae bacterium]
MIGSIPYIIEFKDNIYQVIGKNIETIQKFEASKGDKFLICDFPGSVSKVMTVESPVKYAESMVVRKLHEEGEFDEPVSIITHQKRKSGDKSTEIFFTAVASKIYAQYIDRINEQEDTVILFSLYTVLFNLFKKLPSNKPFAIVFRHSTYADLIIGTQKRIIFASRCTGFDTSQEQVSALWDMVARDISVAEEDNFIEIDKVICVNWIDTHTDEIIDNQYLEYQPFKEDKVFYENEAVNVSFINVIKMLSAWMGSTKRYNALLYYTKNFSSIAAFLLLFVAVGLIAGYVHFSKKATLIKQNEKHIMARIDGLKKEISLKPVTTDFDSVFKFVDGLYLYKNAPSFRHLINDIEKGLFSAAKVESLKITYTGTEAKTEVYGSIKLDFDNAYQGYQILVKNLMNKGYTIIENNFNTQINRSEFRLIFSRSIQ